MCAKRVDKDHPDYPVYIEKCWALQKKYQPMIVAEEERLKAERPDWMNCMDGLESVQKTQLYRQMHAELKALQKEYSYLFTEDIPDDQDHP